MENFLFIGYNQYDNFKHQAFLKINGCLYELVTDTGIPADNKWVLAPHIYTTGCNTDWSP